MHHPSGPARNGYAPAPPQPGGAVRAAERTRFPPELGGGGLAPLLHTLGRAEILGVRALRWALILLAASAAILWVLADGWTTWLALLPLLLAAVLAAAYVVMRRRDFVEFLPAEGVAPPSSLIAPLAPADKVPVYVTGALGVNQRVVRFTCLPGFYRTFASREHVIIGAREQSRVGAVASWPEREVGLWYSFFLPAAIRSVQQGRLSYGSHNLPAVEIRYEAEWKTASGSRRTTETLRLATASEPDLERILADIAVDTQASAKSADQPRQGRRVE